MDHRSDFRSVDSIIWIFFRPTGSICRNAEAGEASMSTAAFRRGPVVSVALYALYHLLLYCPVLHRRTRFASEVHDVMRERYWGLILANPEKQALGCIHSLRNFIMSASFLATTALVLTTSAVGLILQSDGDPDRRVKLTCLAVCTFLAFFHFSQTVRLLVQLTFLFQSQCAAKALLVGQDRRAMMCYRIGTRLMYFLGPLAAWIAGPTPMLVCTLILIPYLFYLDMADTVGLHEQEALMTTPPASYGALA